MTKTSTLNPSVVPAYKVGEKLLCVYIIDVAMTNVSHDTPFSLIELTVKEVFVPKMDPNPKGVRVAVGYFLESEDGSIWMSRHANEDSMFILGRISETYTGGRYVSLLVRVLKQLLDDQNNPLTSRGLKIQSKGLTVRILDKFAELYPFKQIVQNSDGFYGIVDKP